MMKILVVLTGGIRADGITAVWLTYCREFIRQGLLDRLQLDFGVIDGISDRNKVEEFEMLGLETIPLPNRQRNPLCYYMHLAGVLRQGAYDAVHANGSSSLMCVEMLAAKMAGVAVRISHSRNTECSLVMLNVLLRPLFLHLCTARFACGEAAGRWLFGNRRFVVINNGKDFSQFHYNACVRKEVRTRLGLGDDFVIGHVGWFSIVKNQSFLVDVFEEFQRLVPNSVLYLMGTGRMLEDVKRRVAGKGLEKKVIFAGLVDDMPARLQAMDMMALPSLHEGLPNVVLEWQALGLPSLLADTVTKACAVSSLVEFECLEKSPQEWAFHLKEMYDQRRDREKDAERGIASLRREGFDIVDDARFLYEQYEKLIGQKKEKYAEFSRKG